MRLIFMVFFCLFVLAGCSEVLEPEIVQAEESTDGDWIPLPNGSFTTKYDSSLKNRTLNLEIAARTVDGIVIAPGDIFSFNEIIGKATWAKGYRPAKIFFRGKERQGMGGGICQLSSTLYNAADYGGLEIIERHAHSKKVHYVEPGRDAATAYGGVDLKFKNNLPYPVRIGAWLRDGELTVELSTHPQYMAITKLC
ncbi:MAG: VanW family protein [Clostridiales bacterium]|nr:VanW family protein [Clostridiales bacterium]